MQLRHYIYTSILTRGWKNTTEIVLTCLVFTPFTVGHCSCGSFHSNLSQLAGLDRLSWEGTRKQEGLAPTPDQLLGSASFLCSIKSPKHRLLQMERGFCVLILQTLGKVVSYTMDHKTTRLFPKLLANNGY